MRYRIPHAQYEQNGCTVLFTRHQSTKLCQAFSIFWLVVQKSVSKVGVAKNKRDVLGKWMLREKYVKYQNFPTPFGLSLSLECSGKISRQSVKSAYPMNLLKVAVFLPKSNARHKFVKAPVWGRFVNNSRHARRLSCLIKPQTIGTTGPVET